MAKRFSDIDKGYGQFLKTIRELKTAPGIFVGVRADAGNDRDGTSIAFIAAVNEFGSEDGHVPERSFLRSTIDEKTEQYVGQMGRALAKAIDGKVAIKRGFGIIGAGAAADVQRKITSISSPANAKSTIQAKGSSNPLIEDGQLRASIDFEVRGD